MNFKTYITPKAIKGKRSRIEGQGLFAIKPISKGEIVAIKGGHIINRETRDNLSESLSNSEVQIADDFYIAALSEDEYEEVMMYLNHSCEPNIGLMGNIIFVAMRDINIDEELTTDYALFDNDDDPDYEMECKCGTNSCRKVITGKDWQRKDLQTKYGNYFSAYLLAKIAKQ